MAEYIDKNKAIELIKELENIKDVSEAEEWVDIFISTINELPFIELKHGKWIVNNETKEWVTIYCDQCHDGMWNRKDDPYPNYCFNCGARMDGVENET